MEPIEFDMIILMILIIWIVVTLIMFHYVECLVCGHNDEV